MHSILAHYRSLSRSLEDSVRWSCTLEAVAPKLGNVHPSAQFDDLAIHHFIVAGEALAKSCRNQATVGEIVFAAVTKAVEDCGTNVNLGIALLIAPLVTSLKRNVSIARVLGDLSETDASLVYAAIARANPGGLGKVDELDVRGTAPTELLEAMRLAEQRDLIARQYTNNFTDLLTFVVPKLEQCIGTYGDLLWGVRRAQIEILAEFGDSLVERKCGEAVCGELKQHAGNLLRIADNVEFEIAAQEFDQWLRADGHRRNPGTTADMIAAGLFVLLNDKLEVLKGA